MHSALGLAGGAQMALEPLVTVARLLRLLLTWLAIH